MRVLFLFALCSVLAHAGLADYVDDAGRLERLPLDQGWINVDAQVRVATLGWERVVEFSSGAHRKTVRPDGVLELSGTVSDGGKKLCQIEQAVSEEQGEVRYTLRTTPEGLDGRHSIAGTYFWLNLSSAQFAGGTFQFDGQVPEDLPATLPENFRLKNGLARVVTFTTPDGAITVRLAFDRLTAVLVQDARRWQNSFSVLISAHKNVAVAGEMDALEVRLRATGKPDLAPVKIEINPNERTHTLQALGGNYCFQLNTPETRYTLDNLHVAAGRTEMSLHHWEPKNDNADPSVTNWSAIVVADRPDSRLREELEMMRELSRRKVPYAASIWKVPGWLSGIPPERDEKVRIERAQWPELAESISSYLVYAREKYNAEPDFFSFNEPDIGVRVHLTPEEHRDLIKALSARFEKLGLKTKLLLGDVASPRKTHGYVEATAADPDAMRYCGALAFHSWGGATPEQYRAWRALADRLKLPLWVAEAGVDPDAWRGGRYATFDYGVREAQHYQELLLHARPEVILRWEFTGDYGLLDRGEKPNEKRAGERYYFQKHFINLTPPGSVGVKVESSNPNVLLTAFRHPDSKKGYTLHLSNSLWERDVEIHGLPEGLKLRIVRTRHGELFANIDTIKTTRDPLRLTIPKKALITLTTLKAEK